MVRQSERVATRAVFVGSLLLLAVALIRGTAILAVSMALLATSMFLIMRREETGQTDSDS